MPAERGFTNFTDWFSLRAVEHPERIALWHPAGTLNYREIERLIWQAAAHLRAQGVVPGLTVVPACDEELSILFASLGALRLGATVFSPPRGLAAPQLAAELARAGATVVIGSRQRVDSPPVRQVPFDLERIAGEDPSQAGLRCARPSAPAILSSTSGSTGRTRQISVGHEAYLDRLYNFFARTPLQSDDRLFSQVHLDYETGRRFVVTTLFHGGTVVLVDRRTRPSLVDVCSKHRITIVWSSVADLEQELTDLPAVARAPALPTVRELYVGTATVSESLRRRTMDRLTPGMHIRYGTNEAGLVSTATPEQIRRQPGTVGVPAPGVEVQIVDREGQPVAAGETGEIRIRRSGMFEGYREDPEADACALRNGWFHPGDLGRWAPDGQLIHCGRVDDLMIVAGVNVYPAEIERAIGEHPAVREAAAFPLRVRDGQEIPVCAVVARAGEHPAGDELRSWMRNRMGNRAPRLVVVLDELPRMGQGKIDRSRLREQVEQRLVRQPDAAAARPASAMRRTDDSAAGDRNIHRLQIEFRSPAAGTVAGLEAWFTHWLEIAVSGGGVPEGSRGADASGTCDAAAARSFLRHALTLAQRILQAGGVPAFGEAGIEQCAAQPQTNDRWRATVLLPAVTGVGASVSALALRAALDACRRLAQSAWPDEAARQVADVALGQAMREIIKTVPQGKSTIPLLRAAHAKGIPIEHLGRGVYQLGWGSRAVRTNRSMTAGDSALGASLVQSKSGAASALRLAGLPAPVHGLAYTWQQAAQWAQRLGWPVVVKPDDADRGEGVSVDVSGEEQLRAAFDAARARRPGKPVLIERQVPGVCHRLFIVRGRLLYAVRRLPKSVPGDGKSTVAALIGQANRRERELPPWSRTGPYPDDDEARAAIERAGFAMDAVPPADVPVPLRRIESTAAGGFDQDVTAAVHPVNIDAALRAAALFDLDVAGVDIISTDIGEPWFRSGAVINEVNFAPLLGGGEISRSHIPEFLARIVEDDGRIPVEEIVDRSPDLAQARQHQQQWVQRGLRCWLTDARRTIGPDGFVRPMPFGTREERFRALILDRQVDAIVLVADPAGAVESP